MSSSTIHVIGCAQTKRTAQQTKEQLYYAMSRVEMEQQRRIAQQDGLHIAYWYAQTKQGERILGGWLSARDADAPKARLIDCDVCDSLGCTVCNYSGVTTPKNKERWAEWQLQNIRRDALLKLRRLAVSGNTYLYRGMVYATRGQRLDIHHRINTKASIDRRSTLARKVHGVPLD